jgi:hypothetical protein
MGRQVNLNVDIGLINPCVVVAIRDPKVWEGPQMETQYCSEYYSSKTDDFYSGPKSEFTVKFRPWIG